MRGDRRTDAVDRRADRPELGPPHGARATAQVIPNPDVVMLDDNIGHWPQIEAPDAVLENFWPTSIGSLRSGSQRLGQDRDGELALPGPHSRLAQEVVDRGRGVVDRLPIPAQPPHHLG